MMDKRVMWVPILVLAVLGSGLPAASPLRDYDAVLEALREGARVRAVIDYGRCKLTLEGQGKPAPQAIGGMDLTPFEHFAPGVAGNKLAFLVSSQTSLISHPRYGYVLNYVKIRLDQDGTATISARYLDPRTYEVRMDETFATRIAGKHDNGGLFLFLVR